MKTIVGSRQSGRTTQAIKMSEQTGDIIVCASKSIADFTKRLAIDTGHKIPSPISYTEINCQKGKNVNFIFDNADSILQQIFFNKINCVTMQCESNELMKLNGGVV